MLWNLVKISRPVFWIIPLLSYCAGLFFGTSFSSLTQDPFLTILIALQAVSFTFPFGLFGYGLNDYYDREGDTYNQRKDVIDIDWDTVWYICITSGFFLGFISFLFFILYGKVWNFAIVFILGWIGFFYSYDNVRFKEVPLLAGAVNFVAYWVIPYCLGYLLFNDAMSFSLFSQVFGIGMMAFAVYNLANVVDVESDRRAGYQTLPVRVGVVPSILIGFSVALSGFVLSFPETFLYKVAGVISLLIFLSPLLFDDRSKGSYYADFMLGIVFLLTGFHYIFFIALA